MLFSSKVKLHWLKGALEDLYKHFDQDYFHFYFKQNLVYQCHSIKII
jgi:hypothetical protein